MEAIDNSKKLKKSVKIKLKKQAQKEFVSNNATNQGASSAALNDVPTSPRKMRLVVDLIRGKQIEKAQHILLFSKQDAAKRLHKLLMSAIANWMAKNADASLEQAYVKTIFVDSGRMLKRMRPAPQGRGYRVRKRSNHVTIVIDTLTTVNN